MNIETTIIIAIITLSGALIPSFLQWRNYRSQAKKAESEASGIIIDTALKLHQQDFEVLRYLNKILEESVKEKDLQIVNLKRIIREQECEIEELRRK